MPILVRASGKILGLVKTYNTHFWQAQENLKMNQINPEKIQLNIAARNPAGSIIYGKHFLANDNVCYN